MAKVVGVSDEVSDWIRRCAETNEISQGKVVERLIERWESHPQVNLPPVSKPVGGLVVPEDGCRCDGDGEPGEHHKAGCARRR